VVRKSILLVVFVLWLPLVAGCTAVSTRLLVPDAATPDVERVATADLTRGWVQTAVPTVTAVVPNTTRVAATVGLPATQTPQPLTSVPTVAWNSFTSPKHGYVIAYPSEMNVAVENTERVGDAVQVERVIFKLPNDGTPIQSTALTIEVAQRAFSRPVECQNQTELIPGIQGCRRSLPSPQGTSQELVWFRVPAPGPEHLYFSLQLIYDDLKYVTAFAHMLQTLKYSGTPATVTPPSQSGCSYKSAFLGDVTIPDHTVVAPGASFVKTWRVQNEGTCVWGYNSALHRLVFVGGDPLGSSKSLELPFPSLGQGGTTDLSVPMVAPTKPGTYQSQWRLQVEDGTLVGVGPSGDASLTVRIVVPGPGTLTPTPKVTKNYKSSKHGYSVSYPAEWTVNVQTFTPAGAGRDPEAVLLSAPNAMWATVQIYAQKGAPPIQSYVNCKNMMFNGVPACEINKTDGPVPQRSLLFQKGDSYFLMDTRYTTLDQLDRYEEIVLSFRFTP
jgi:hypothetical protein